MLRLSVLLHCTNQKIFSRSLLLFFIILAAKTLVYLLLFSYTFLPADTGVFYIWLFLPNVSNMLSSGICRVVISCAEGQRDFGSNYSAYSLRLVREHSLSGARNSSKQSWCSQLYKHLRCHPPSICWIKDGNNMLSKPVDRMVQT